MVRFYGRKSDAVVAYVFRGELLCPACVVGALPTGEGEAFDGWAVAPGVNMSTEDNLSEIAYAFGINRMDESTFDSGEFPKVVFDVDLTAGETCDSCGGEL